METKLFDLVSDYQPQGDQPKAIQELVDGIQKGKKQQVLLGATGTGKTFTISNVIAKVNKPTLVFAHNKTLAGQLYSEFKEFSFHLSVPPLSSSAYPELPPHYAILTHSWKAERSGYPHQCFQ